MAEKEKSETPTEEIERIYTLKLRKTQHCPPSDKRAPRAIKEIREFVARHLKIEEDKVWIDGSVNRLIFLNSARNVPHKITIKVKYTPDIDMVEVRVPE